MKDSDWRERYVSWLERRAARPRKRLPLTPEQHILNLLLTVFTGGLWGPVWVVRAWRGNPNPRWLEFAAARDAAGTVQPRDEKALRHARRTP